MERALRSIAWLLGPSSTATLARLWRALPRCYRRHTHYLTIGWWAYAQVLPTTAHIMDKAGTLVVEALNGKLRHRCGVLVRHYRSFSECSTSHLSRVTLAINHHNSQITIR